MNSFLLNDLSHGYLFCYLSFLNFGKMVNIHIEVKGDAPWKLDN
jgi:hypothetical protein